MDSIEEIWKNIDGYDGYEVSNFGRVASNKYKNRRILKQQKRKTGYLEIGLSNKNKVKWILVHRLVLATFQPISGMENMEVNHKDENKENNRIDNLEWVTSKENCNYGTRNFRLSMDKNVPVECVETGIIYKSFHEVAEKTGIEIASINMCCTGYRNRKTAGGYHWRYA